MLTNFKHYFYIKFYHGIAGKLSVTVKIKYKKPSKNV